LNDDLVQKVTNLGLLPFVLKLYKKTSVFQEDHKMSHQEFGAWLSGFTDAEGNFQVFFDRNYLRVAYRITLHIDDVNVLYKIQEFLGAGFVEKHTNSCVFVLRNVNTLLIKLVPIFENYPLRTIKQLDYLDFKNIIILLTNAKSSAVKGQEKEIALAIIKGMNSGRDKQSWLPVNPTDLPINKYWLLGFIEGEGTFGIKNLVPYFQIGQHKRDIEIMDKISIYLKNKHNLFGFTLNSPTLNATIVTHKKTDVVVYSYQNIDSLFDSLAYFLLDLPFQTRKNIDFLYWCIVLYMHKFGFFYLNEGRKLTIEITKYINTSRYSTSGKDVQEPIIDPDIFNMNLPVTLTPLMSHLNLAQTFSRLKGPREVWVYDKGTLLKGSPFSSNVSACEIIGLDRKSSIVRRYIDTDKIYNNRYKFYSKRL